MTIKSDFLLISLLLLCSSWMPAAYAETTVTLPNQQQTVSLNIENMNCALCTITIKKALQKVEGVQNVIVDYDAKRVMVTFDSYKTNSAALIKATTDAGYPGSLAAPISR